MAIFPNFPIGTVQTRPAGQSPVSRRVSASWIMLFTAASTVTTLLLACATPFASLAALAAVHMRRRDGVALMLAAWAASQMVGFFVLKYPHDWRTLCWIPGLGTAAIASVLGAYAVLDRMRGGSTVLRLAVAYVTGFVAFKLVVLCWAFLLGGVESTINPAIVLRQFGRNGAILIGLYLFYRSALALGMPAAGHRAATA